LANKKALGRFGALSLTDSEPTTGKHSDPVTVMYWNCIGSVEWNVFTENKNYSFVLQPGDVILVPANMLHEVKSLGPRAAISFMFES
jgi:quercetin dioxygenase-like cupin family protein